jgi:integrase
VSHVEKRIRAGRVTYRARWREASGRERVRTFARMTDARRFLVEVEDSKYRGAYVDPSAGRLDVGAQAERWFASTAALKPTTRRDYRSLLDCHVLPRFQDWPLAGVDTLAVREWVATLVDGGLGPKRAGKALQVLSLVLSSAVEGGKLARNATAGVKPPKVQRREMLFLDAEQVQRLAAVVDTRYRVLVLCSAYAGLRPCELVALRVGRLDLLRGTVRVAEAAPEVAGRLCWGTVKTHEARTVRLPRFLVAELAAYLAGRPHDPTDLVFTAARGGPLRESKWCRVNSSPLSGRRGSPRDCAGTTCGTPARACSSGKAPASRQFRSSSATRPRPSLWTSTATCSPTSWTHSPSGLRPSMPERSRPQRDPPAPQSSSRWGKAQADDSIVGCRRRGSNPHARGAQRF